MDDNNDRYKDGKYSGGNQISDDDLFKRPPPPKDCPICLLPLPSLISGSIYMNCCGKTICSGCIHAPVYDDKGNVMTKCPFCISVPSETKCPFCRTPAPSSNEETLERYKKRAEIGDAEAIRSLACFYRDGTLGLPQDNDKVFELFVRAGELGCAGACNNVGYAYENGTGVERDAKKARHYFKLAAMRGGCNSKA